MSYLPIREVCCGLRAYYQEADEAAKNVFEETKKQGEN